MRDVLRRVFGAGLIGVAGLGFIGIIQQPPPSPGGAAFILTLIALAGVAVLRPFRSKAPQAVDGAERVVLEAARANKGRITATEIAADGRLSHADAQAELERLDRAGACRSLIAESGIMVYYFPEFERADAKSDVFFGEEEEARARRDAARATEEQ